MIAFSQKGSLLSSVDALYVQTNNGLAVQTTNAESYFNAIVCQRGKLWR